MSDNTRKMHLVIDFAHIYYRYKFRMMSAESSNWRGASLKRLSIPTYHKDENDVTVEHEKDVTMLYYPLSEIEGFRKKLSKQYDVTCSICFDMPSKRNAMSVTEGDPASQYKRNRKKILDEGDFENIREIEEILKNIGYNTYRIDGYEADDIINFIVRKYSDNFDFTTIVTNDADLLSLINSKVCMLKHNTTKGYQQVYMGNFSEIANAAFKCNMPYNAVMLYKSTCSDPSDGIKGIPRFGPKAFEKLCEYLSNPNKLQWEKLSDADEVGKALELSRGYLKDDEIEQAKLCLNLVRPLDMDDEVIQIPTKKDSLETRRNTYAPYMMKSLIE